MNLRQVFPLLFRRPEHSPDTGQVIERTLPEGKVPWRATVHPFTMVTWTQCPHQIDSLPEAGTAPPPLFPLQEAAIPLRRADGRLMSTMMARAVTCCGQLCWSMEDMVEDPTWAAGKLVLFPS